MSYAQLQNYNKVSPGIVSGSSYNFQLTNFKSQLVQNLENPLGTNSLAKLTGQLYQPVDKAYPMNCSTFAERKCSSSKQSS